MRKGLRLVVSSDVVVRVRGRAEKSKGLKKGTDLEFSENRNKLVI